MSAHRRTSVPAALALLILAVAACDPSGPGVGPPAELSVSGLGGTLVVGQAQSVTVTVRDDNGKAVGTETVTWSVSGGGTVSPGSVETDNTGSASSEWTFGTAAGSQSLTVAAGTIDTTVTVDVVADALAAIILDPASSTMTALEDTVVIAATGQDQYGNAVTLSAVTWASSDTVVATVADGVVISHANGSADITATSGAVTDTATVTVSASGGMAVGESVVLLGDNVASYELTDTGTYVITVFNTTASATATTAFHLKGSIPTVALADGESAGRAPASVIRLPTERATMEPDPETEGHLRMLERDRRLVERLGPPVRRPAPAPLAADQVGDVRTFKIPDLDGDNLCTVYDSVTARAVYVGTYGVVWEDTTAPVAGQMDSMWVARGLEYDSIMHPLLVADFGDPLAYDDRLDNNGLLYMLFSKVVNDYTTTSVNGFVTSADFYSASVCPSSDNAEIFYGRVPTSTGRGFDSDQTTATQDEWAWSTRSTIIHEVKHITANANKFDAGASTLEESGLEEATARLAEEFYGRALQGYGQFDNTGYDASIYCERRVGPSWPACDPIPVIMNKHYGAINTYLMTPSLLSPFGRVDSGDATFYGSGWQWVRWVIDQSGVAEADFIKALIREPTLTGAANLADKAGRTVGELLGDYTLAIAVDDEPGFTPARTALTMPSWDTRDMFQGLYTDYNNSTYPTPWPLASQDLTGGSFLVDVPEIHGGGAAFFQLGGMTGPQRLELLSETDGTAPASLGLAIVRIR